MAKSSTKKRSSIVLRSKKKSTVDKIAKAATSREMLGAGCRRGGGDQCQPGARRKIRDAALDAADTASQAATTVVSSASKLGALIAEAVADAAQRVMTGKWSDDDDGGTRAKSPSRAKSTARKGTKRKTTKRKTTKRKTAAKSSTAAARKSSAAGTRQKTAARQKPTTRKNPVARKKPAARNTCARPTR